MVRPAFTARLALPILLFALVPFIAYGAGREAVGDVRISRDSFNPAIGNTVEFKAAIGKSGRLTATVVNRDGAVVRTLAKRTRVAPGETSLQWDGRDEAGKVVIDDAYSLRLELVAGRKHFPFPDSTGPPSATLLPPKYYDRERGMLSYELPTASRVRIDAFVQSEGRNDPTRMTIVANEPRSAGSVIDHWNGRSPDGAWLPGLPGFAVRIEATPLPPASVIAFGNRTPVTSASSTPY